jgi:cytochrome c-type biogenesis protein
MLDSFDAFAFGVGMIALINPCGFALLPAYLGVFLGLDEDPDQSRIVSLNRAQLVGLALSAGFLLVFGLLGLVFAGFYSSIADSIPWFTLVVGVALVILGIAMLRGLQLSVAIPKLNRGGTSGSMVSMFLFGISYAIASLSCTIGLFLAVVGTSSASRGFSDRLGSFISYGAGMGLLATTLTLAVAFAKGGFVNKFRELLPKINKISAVILLIVGVYVALYGVWSIQVLGGSTPPIWLDDFILGAERFQTDVATAVESRASILGWGFVALNVAIVVAGLAARGGSEDSSDKKTPATT